MGKITNFRTLIGKIKDKASQSKAAIISNPKTLSLHLALLRATTHDPFTLPDPKHITTILSFGHSSRPTAAAAIEALMDRLQSTNDSSVAIKCLISVHHIIKHGSFILQDQLSIYPSAGGRNYLNLSDFRHNTTPLTWELSSWVRWYAGYLEHLLSTSRTLGFFLCSTSSTAEKDKEEEKVSALTNADLLRDLDSLAGLMEEISKRPDSLYMHGNNCLVGEVMAFVADDFLSAINDISIRVYELNHRLGYLSFGDSVELFCVLKRLEDCQERLSALSSGKKAAIDGLWCVISELKDEVGKSKSFREEKGGRILLAWGGRSRRVTESARFEGQLLSSGGSVQFSSARFGSNSYDLSSV